MFKRTVKQPYKIGTKFGSLTIISQPFFKEITNNNKESGKQKSTFYLCKCDCDNEVEICGANLTTGNSTTCGCRNLGYIYHNYTKHKLYRTWHWIKARCYNKNNKYYDIYGGRGIYLSEEWHNPKTFIEDNLNLGWKPELSIDRIDNNGPYSKDNVKWSTQKEQQNNKRSNRILIAFGESKNMKQWSEDPRCLLNYWTLRGRIEAGWDIEEAITTPAIK